MKTYIGIKDAVKKEINSLILKQKKIRQKAANTEGILSDRYKIAEGKIELLEEFIDKLDNL